MLCLIVNKLYFYALVFVRRLNIYFSDVITACFNVHYTLIFCKFIFVVMFVVDDFVNDHFLIPNTDKILDQNHTFYHKILNKDVVFILYIQK